MTKHSKIPATSKSNGGSLLERASGVYGLESFAPAPVPEELSQPPLKRGAAKKPKAAAKVAPDEVTAPRPKNVVEFSERTQTTPLRAVPHEEATHQDISGEAEEIEVQPIHLDGPVQEVDRRKLAEQGFIVPDGAVTALFEEFRIVKRAVLDAARKSDKAQRVLVCSPLPGEGKTFCATNLALAIAAEKDCEVLLVDADFAKPSVLSRLGLIGGIGLMDALADPSVQIEDGIIKTDIDGLYVLPAGASTASDAEQLTRRGTAELLERLTAGAPNRIVIFDSPPALVASPAAELAKHVGQAVLVVRADMTGKSAMEDSLQLLGACRDIKLLLNDARFSPSGRRFGAYYGYGG